MNTKLTLGFALALSGGLFGCATTGQQGWPVFYDSEKTMAPFSVSRVPVAMAAYTNGIPEWNIELRVPGAKINSAGVKELGVVSGMRVMEVQLGLVDSFYTDELMILEEVTPEQFLPVYVQLYNKDVGHPSGEVVLQKKDKLIVQTGMDYEGTGHFHSQHEIKISPGHDPVVTGSFY